MSAAETLKKSHRPDGNIADALARLTLAQLRTLRSTTVCTCRRDLKFPIAPMGKADALARLTLAQMLTLRSTPGCTCTEILKTSHRPNGKMADVLDLILACTTANVISVNYSLYVPQRP